MDGHQKPRLAASMKSRHYDKPDDFQPGPGHNQQIAPSRSKRHLVARVQASIERRSSTAVFTRSLRFASRLLLFVDLLTPPSTGAYKLADTVGGTSNGLSYTMRPKNPPKTTSDAVPGPGETHSHAGARSRVMVCVRSSLQMPVVARAFISPPAFLLAWLCVARVRAGTYSIATSIGTAPSKSMTSRRSAAKGDVVPGPGP